ncbi:MAG: glutamate racemase [Planctomycetes bacterium]|nr:glutamate racemase [Planctomycetota bacterium]
MDKRPIAVFDSGLGGLSVVRHLRESLPNEDIVYFGDTARVPYGTKTRTTVVKFALEDAHYLLRFEPKLIVVACNTASALAIDEVRRESPVPVVGVVEPGALAAAERAGGGTIAILGTEATINSQAYPKAIAAAGCDAPVFQIACPLFVPLVEEGRDPNGPIVRMTVDEYLAPLRQRDVHVVVLGCTHYPLLREPIAAALGTRVKIVDSGCEAARTVHSQLERNGGLCRESRIGTMHSYVSDNPARFRAVGSRFLEHPIEHVELVDPEHYIR